MYLYTIMDMYYNDVSLRDKVISLCRIFLNATSIIDNPTNISEITTYIFAEYIVNGFSININENNRKKLEIKLKTLSLSESGKTIGVYGVGRHTEVLMELYERFVGKIQADVFFIVTHKEIDMLNNRRVIQVDQIKEPYNRIIISSRLYEKEMKSMLEKTGIASSRVVSLYNDNDWIDIVVTNKILTMCE